MKTIDIHVQRRDYGYMLCNRTARTNKEAIKLAKQTWRTLMNSNATRNQTTRKRLKNGYFRGFPFRITIMKKDSMKGLVMFDDFGKLPQNTKTFIVDE